MMAFGHRWVRIALILRPHHMALARSRSVHAFVVPVVFGVRWCRWPVSRDGEWMFYPLIEKKCSPLCP